MAESHEQILVVDADGHVKVSFTQPTMGLGRLFYQV